MSNRREDAEAFTDGGGVEVPSWGRIKRLVTIGPQFLKDNPSVDLDAEGGELDMAELLDSVPALGDIFIALYTMPFERWRALSETTYQEECDKFSSEVDIAKAVEILKAARRDWKSIEASLIEFIPSGKTKGEEAAEQNLSQKQTSLQPVSA